ncbi:MAG: UDP-N-acetylmuramate dehydrogenase [bacterium]
MKLQNNIPLGPFTTYRVGGPADLFVVTKSRTELIEALVYAQQHKIPYFILGLGANILVSDKGFRGLVIKNEYSDCRIEVDSTNEPIKTYLLHTGSGATIQSLIDVSKKYELSGLEHFAGIPSTVGGALWQNLHFLNPDRSGTFFIEEVVHHAAVLNMATGQEQIFYKKDFTFGYDTSILHQGNHVVIDAVFQLQKSTHETIVHQVQENLTWRNARHPSLDTYYSCGSVFKKVHDIAAAKLIDQCGLKGFQYRGVQVSVKHPNFITHTGNATATAIKYVINHVQQVVFERTGIMLETEIQMIGEW